jgi:hypothetical protein
MKAKERACLIAPVAVLTLLASCDPKGEAGEFTTTYYKDGTCARFNGTPGQEGANHITDAALAADSIDILTECMDSRSLFQWEDAYRFLCEIDSDFGEANSRDCARAEMLGRAAKEAYEIEMAGYEGAVRALDELFTREGRDVQWQSLAPGYTGELE